MAVDPSFNAGIVGNVISIPVFASLIGTFRRVVKKKSTENFKWQPYATTLLGTSPWTFCGLLKPGGLLVVTVNGIGSLLQAIYVALFLIYAPRETRVRMAKFVAILNVGFLGLVILVTLLAIHGSVRLILIGFMRAALTVGMYASPLAAMRMVVKKKSVEYMPFFLSFFLFLNGGVWSIYSVLVQDYFIGKTVITTKSVEYMPFFLSFFLFLNGAIWTVYAVLSGDIFLGIPNGIGFLLGTIQLVLYMIYMNTKASKHSGEAVEGRWQHQQLIKPDGACGHDEEEGLT